MRAGLAAEFADVEALRGAIEALRGSGLHDLDAFTPHPAHEIEEALGLPRSRLNWLVFPVAMLGAGAAFLLQSWCNAVDYALDVGGRPPLAWPTNIPITFESGVLAASLFAFLALFVWLGFPALSHPLFRVDGFERASLDRYWLAIGDQPVDRPRLIEQLMWLGALRVTPFGGARS
jgi:hypothetical protein